MERSSHSLRVHIYEEKEYDSKELFKTVDRNIKGCHNWQLKGDKFKL